MANIVRVFRATIKPGKEEAFRAFFIDDAIPILRSHKGLVSVQVGVPRNETPQEFLMVTTWSSLEAMIEFTGENWREAVIDEREADLIAETNVYHYSEALPKAE